MHLELLVRHRILLRSSQSGERSLDLDDDMNSERLSLFRNLWTTEASKYALVRVGGGAEDLSRCIILNTQTRMALVIEDEEVCREVKRRMKGAGVPILNQLP